VSAALDLLYGLKLEDGRRWGEAAADFQRADAEAILEPGDGPPFNFLTRSRGGSKTSDLAGIAIAAMLAQAPPGARLYAVAADAKQASLLVQAVAGFAHRTPELRGVLDPQTWRVAVPRSGVVLEVMASDEAGAWGLRPYLLIADELAAWQTTPPPRRLWEAASSACAKLSNARLVVLTTAGDPAHWSRAVRDHSLDDPLWRLHEVHGPAPWLAEDRLAEQRRRLPDSLFRRLFLNEWTAAEDRLATDDDLEACVTLAGSLPPERGKRYCIGLDVGLKRDRTVAAVCHGERIGADGDDRTLGVRVVLDRMEVWQGSRRRPVQLRDVEEWLAETSRAYNLASVRYDPWQAVGSAQRLKARRVRVDEYGFSPTSIARLALTLLQTIRDKALDLPDDPELLDELRNVRIRETSPGVPRLDHDPDRHDDRVIALALAASFVLDRSRTATRGRIYDPSSIRLPDVVGVPGRWR
jgi:phage terminase large subunit-like protein